MAEGEGMTAEEVVRHLLPQEAGPAHWSYPERALVIPRWTCSLQAASESECGSRRPHRSVF
jgi:hypothetical protein